MPERPCIQHRFKAVSFQAELIRVLSSENHVVRNEVTEGASRKRVGGEMRLQRDAGESRDSRESVSHPLVPRWVWVTFRKNCSHRHNRDLVP